MGVKFLGTPIEQFDQLCKEEEKVVITISCYKSDKEGLVYPDSTITYEDILTSHYGRQIKSSKDIFSFDGDAAKVYAVDYNKRQELVN
jgi:hypothetical protein